MNANQVMNTKDAIRSKFAQVFAETEDGKRYKMLMCKDFEAKANIKTQDVPRMGSIIMGKQPTTVELPFKMTIYKCTEIFDDIVRKFIETGAFPNFKIQCYNEDPASSVGSSDKTFNDCVLDGDVLLALGGSGDDFIEQEISGFAGSYESKEKFTNPSYML